MRRATRFVVRASRVQCHAAAAASALVAPAWCAPSLSCRGVLSESMKGMNADKLSPSAIDRAILRRFTESDFDQIERIYNAYMGYFNHIKFRKGWDKPRYEPTEVEPLFREAAEYVYRVRQHLDHGKPAGETTLRQIDGEAQRFLQSETGPRLLKSDQSSFVGHLVHATLSDARGYVEGLTPEAINQMVAKLQRHRFSPAEHLRHVLLEGLETIEKADVRAMDPERPLHYVEEGSDEDKSWRASINAAYDAAEAALKAIELRKAVVAKVEAAMAEQELAERKAEAVAARDAKIAEQQANVVEHIPGMGTRPTKEEK